MVMADREGVETASVPVTALTMLGLVGNMVNGLARIPFQKPLSGPGGVLDNIGQAVTRQSVRSFLGYSVSLPIEEFRSMEKILDQICGVVLTPVVGALGGVEIESDVVGGQEGIWCRAKPEVAAADEQVKHKDRTRTILYLHGGGYFGTTPKMYTMFAAALVRLTGCQLFIPDYRMSPEFPFPAGMHDAADVYQGLLDRGIDAQHLIVAGDSGGGGLATSLMVHLHQERIPRPRALVLFSPEVDLDFSQDSVMVNARYDVLPWNIPVTSYLRGIQPNDSRVSAVFSAPQQEWFPPTFVCWGDEEMFRDSIREFASNLRAGGVTVVPMEERGMFHVFPILMPWSEAAKRVFQQIELLATSVTDIDSKKAIAAQDVLDHAEEPETENLAAK
ncbi:MAG: alpha/beta hydrolase [Gordonia sp. (in: high G+C Gram-positive bacteria)]|uniref:alpha/beta hydrolase n=1 Tax=Gordonia sp. (in: high G+C Gram-positive bacteria) TaxID=84139 RepID=UPI003BB769CD